MQDQVVYESERAGALKTVYRDGQLIIETTLAEIRQLITRHA